MESLILGRFDELHRRVAKTAECRFLADYRLKAHHKFSQWTVSFLSVLLLIIPLLQALGAATKFTPQMLNAIQVALAILILVFSLLIGSENYALRADKMHTSGIELRDLAWALESYRGKGGSDEDYERLRSQYSAILKGYENHSSLDYHQLRLQKRASYYPEFQHYVWAWVNTKTAYALNFFPYIFLLVLTVAAVLLLIK